MLDAETLKSLIELAKTGGPVGLLLVGLFVYLKWFKKPESLPEVVAKAVEEATEARIKQFPCQVHPRLYEEWADSRKLIDERFDEVKKEVVATRLEVAGLKGEMRARGMAPT